MANLSSLARNPIRTGAECFADTSFATSDRKDFATSDARTVLQDEDILSSEFLFLFFIVVPKSSDMDDIQQRLHAFATGTQDDMNDDSLAKKKDDMTKDLVAGILLPI
jgi:hypothetical protein